MLLHLVKKDILIAKKIVFATMIIIIAIPLFLTWSAPSISGLLPFLYTVAMGELLLLQSISQEEAKYPKAPALLCAIPYPRSTFVKAKYVLFLLIFVYCCVMHTLVILVINKSNVLDLTTILTVLLFSVLVYGIYMPIEMKYGVVKTKFIFMIVLFALSSGPFIVVNLFPNVNLDFSILMTIPLGIKNIAMAFASIIIFSISMFLSIKIFEKKEL